MASATSPSHASKAGKGPYKGAKLPPTAAIPKGPKVLRIGVVQGGRIIEERIVRKRETISVGHSERNHFVIAAPILPARFELFEMRGGSYFLTFNDEMDGRVSVASGLSDFATLKSEGKAKRKGQFWQVELTEDSRGKVVIGDSTLLFQFVTPPPIQPRPQLPAAARGGWVKNIDWPFVALVMMSFILQFGLVIWIENHDWPVVEGWNNLPDRFAQLLVDEVPTAEDIDRLRDELNGEDGEPTDEGEQEAEQQEEAPQKKAVGKAKGPSMSAEEQAARAEAAARAAAERRARVTEAMSRVAMAKIIGSIGGEGGGAVADVLRGGDVGGDMDDVMSQVRGVGVARGGEGGVLRRVSAGSGDGAGGVANISQLRSAGGNKAVKTGAVGGERQVRGKMKRGSAAVTGGSGVLSPDAVRSTVGRAIGGIKACYERALRRNPTLGGRVTINFTIGGGGRVVSASAANDTLGTAVSGCIVTRFRSLRFPPPEGGNVTFSYPFFFQPAQ
jgi:hypothetical protein